MKKFTFFIYLSTLAFVLNLSFAPPLLTAQDYWKGEEYYQNSSSQKDAATDLMKYVKMRGNESILDVGCGDGKITAEIANKVPQGSVIGVDISPSMIDFAQAMFSQKHYPNLKFLLKNAENLDYKEEFDIVFSFTTLMWIQNHQAFLEGTYHSLKPSGTLAITMTMGLPSTLEKAVTELISSPEWSSYFQDFSTGWNFVQEIDYAQMVTTNRFIPIRLAVVPQRDIFPSREAFEQFISQWFPYLRPLPQNLKKSFLTQVIDRFLELEPPFPNGEVHFKIRRLEVVATKPN